MIYSSAGRAAVDVAIRRAQALLRGAMSSERGSLGSMSSETWRPVVSNGKEDVLVEDFPGYMREAVFRWMAGVVGVDGRWVYSTAFVDFQNAARTSIGFTAGAYLSWADTVMPHLRKIKDADFTNLIDYLLSVRRRPIGEKHPLERILSDGGSAWTVVPWNGNHARLTKRVSDGVRDAVRDVLTAQDVASQKLQEAWIDAYGTSPRASAAYSNAVVAVETAALSVIPLTKKEPTLADLFSILEAEKPKWQLVLRDSDKAPGAKSLAAMLRTIWRGHADRHGSPDYEHVSLDEARAAVILAATLVQWFTSGVVIPVQNQP